MWVNKPKKYVDEEYPELVNLFKNKEDAHNGLCSTIETTFICPCCLKEYKRKIVNVVKAGHITCPTCSDGFPYPEKFMANLLTQLDISFDYHYTDTWTQNYIYDFRLEVNGKKYIIETDGGIGHGHRNLTNLSSEESLAIDKYKDLLATNNGYEIIRIDCNYTSNRFDYIKQSIIDTLYNIVDLSMVDWDECNKKALDSVFHKVIDCYKHKSVFLDEIEEMTHIKQRTIIKYLREAMDCGILPKKILMSTNPYKTIPEGVKFVFDENNFSSRNRKIYCYEDVIIFNSITDAANYYNFDRCSFGYALKNNCLFKGKHFVYLDELDENFDFKPKNDFNSNRCRKIYKYDDSMNLLDIYENATELKQRSPEYNYNTIWKACTNKNRRAYGFRWSYEILTK